MYPRNVPFFFRSRNVVEPNQLLTRTMLHAASVLGHEEYPELYSHVHPHGHATARLARAFATFRSAENYKDSTLDEIELGAYLHDFGKYLISKSILLKPGLLTKEERSIVSLHPVYGAQILSNLPPITETALHIVLYHHERWDGGGYPEGLKGKDIPPVARLVSIVDVYTSLRARRTYKPTLTRLKATLTIKQMAGLELDPEMTQDFLKFIGMG
ncbi:MAG TPA: HD domain-containing phosphohydrolase [Pyrinomonadaceae bacterium]|nr:HD domain-containing phosphohydrolase [Pyrinomonadaceae bacterium]